MTNFSGKGVDQPSMTNFSGGKVVHRTPHMNFFSGNCPVRTPAMTFFPGKRRRRTSITTFPGRFWREEACFRMFYTTGVASARGVPGEKV